MRNVLVAAAPSTGLAGRFDRENAVLLAASHVGAPSHATPTHPLDWPYLLRAANRQGVTPLLYAWLKRRPDIVPDASSASRVHDAYWSTHFHNRLLLAELTRVRRAAAQTRVDLMALKGASLAADYYPAAALRPLGDLDLLVRPRDLAALGPMFQALAYREVDSPPSYIQGDELDRESREYCWVGTSEGLDVLIEYRTVPLDLTVGGLSDFDRPLTAALRRYAAEVWARAETNRAGDVTDPRLSPEDLLLEVATHLAAKHVDFRLIWLHDLARIVMSAPSFDWDYVAKTTAALRLAAPVGAALEAAVRWVGAPITDEHLGGIRAALHARSASTLERWDYRRLSKYVASLGERDLTLAGPGLWPLGSALGRVRGAQSRLSVLRAVALPDRAYLAERGLAATGPLRYVAAGARLLARLTTSRRDPR